MDIELVKEKQSSKQALFERLDVLINDKTIRPALIKKVTKDLYQLGLSDGEAYTEEKYRFVRSESNVKTEGNNWDSEKVYPKKGVYQGD